MKDNQESYNFNSYSENVFICPKCNNFYTNEESHLPISIPCGHIICKTCINSSYYNSYLICPIDSKKISFQLCNLNICKTILENLNVNNKLMNKNEFFCINHKNKKIKYFCEFDNQAFCSLCINNHNEYPHKIIKFVPNKEIINNEINLISNNLEDMKNEIINRKNILKDYENNLIIQMNDNINKLNGEIQKIINIIINSQKLFEEKIKKIFNFNIDKIKEIENNINNNFLDLNSLSNDINNFKVKIENQINYYYDIVINEKNDIIKKYEKTKKIILINCNNFNNLIKNYNFPKIEFNSDKILNIFNKNLINFNIPSNNHNNLNNKNNIEIINNLDEINNLKPTQEMKSLENSPEKFNKKKNLRKSSDPTTQLFRNNYNNKEKPILINYNNLMTLPDNNNKIRIKSNNKLTTEGNLKKNTNNNFSIKNRGNSFKSATNITTSSSKHSKN